MKITYTGKPDQFTQKEQRKLDSRFRKLAKLLDRKDGEKEARASLTSERHLQRAELTINYFDHQVACVGTGADQFHAIADALDKLEKQILKQRSKWRDTKRGSGATVRAAEPAAAPVLKPKTKAAKKVAKASKAAAGEELEPVEAEPKVFRVNPRKLRKPMTFEEAMIEMESGKEYVAYRDADSDKISVLVRRKDGHYALVEG